MYHIKRKMITDIKRFGGDQPRDNLRRVFSDAILETEIKCLISELIEMNKGEAIGIVQMDMDKSKEIRKHGIGYKMIVLNEINMYLEKEFSNICKVYPHGTRDDLTLVFMGGNVNISYVLEKVRVILDGIARKKIGLEFGPYQVTYSAGVAMYPMHGSVVEDLIDLADGAVRKSKDAGGNIVLEAEETFCYITETMIDSIRMNIVEELSITTGKSLQELYREGLKELFEKHSALNRFCVLK